MSIDDDAYFELMMNNCWMMNNVSTKLNEKKGWNDKNEGQSNRNLQERYQSSRPKRQEEQERPVSSTKRAYPKNQTTNIIQSEPQQQNYGSKPAEAILNKFRDRLKARGGKGMIGLQRQFKIFDDNNSKTLEFTEFLKACKDFKVDLNNNEIEILFNTFDNDGSGCVDYYVFLREVRGEMNGYRKKITLQAFDKLDTDKSGVIDISEIKSIFNCKNHPDVKSGKKTEEEVYGEFLETFEMHHGNMKGRRDKKVTREEFLE